MVRHGSHAGHVLFDKSIRSSLIGTGLTKTNSRLCTPLFYYRCGPCKFIGPIFEKLAEEYTEIVFVKVDVDEAEEVAGKCGIQAMPTFQFFRNGKKIQEMKGADQAKLTALINELQKKKKS